MLLAELLFLEHPKCLYCPSTWRLLLRLPEQHGRGFKLLQISKRGYECLIQQATHITKYSARKTSATQTPTKRHSYLSGKTGKEALKRIRVTGKVKIYRETRLPFHNQRGRKRRGLRVKDLPPPLLLPAAQQGARISPRMAEEREGILTPGWWHRPACHGDRNLRREPGRWGTGEGRPFPLRQVRRPWSIGQRTAAEPRTTKSCPASPAPRKPGQSPPHPLLSAPTCTFLPGRCSLRASGRPHLPAAPRGTGRSWAAPPPPSQITPGLRSPSRAPAPRPPAAAAAAAAGTARVPAGGAEEPGPAGSRALSSPRARRGQPPRRAVGRDPGTWRAEQTVGTLLVSQKHGQPPRSLPPSARSWTEGRGGGRRRTLRPVRAQTEPRAALPPRTLTLYPGLQTAGEPAPGV